MARLAEHGYLPPHFQLETALREQLGVRPGHQRVIDGDGELLLVVHEVPAAGVPEREARFFWKTRDGVWVGELPGGGVADLAGLLDRYAQAVDDNEAALGQARRADEVLPVLRHAAPLVRSLRNLVAALEDVLHIDVNDQGIVAARDRAREVERAAELLFADARSTLELIAARSAEAQAGSTAGLSKSVGRLNLLVGLFLPMVAAACLLEVIAHPPQGMAGEYWWLVGSGVVVGALSWWAAGRRSKP